jgi:hypothetical protein
MVANCTNSASKTYLSRLIGSGEFRCGERGGSSGQAESVGDVDDRGEYRDVKSSSVGIGVGTVARAIRDGDVDGEGDDAEAGLVDS